MPPDVTSGSKLPESPLAKLSLFAMTNRFILQSRNCAQFAAHNGPTSDPLGFP
jgi:hypothetical protein